MSKGKLTGLLRSLSAPVQRTFSANQVVRFALIVVTGLFVDYLRELARPCQFLTTAYNFLYCPLIMYIYAEHDQISFLEHAWSLRSLLIIVVAAVIVILWAARDYKIRNR
jgi:uncharacterized membrane protein YhhN